jgi:hypothetical protein
MAARATLTSIQLSFIDASISKQLKKIQALFLARFSSRRFGPAGRRRGFVFFPGSVTASALEAARAKAARLRSMPIFIGRFCDR